MLISKKLLKNHTFSSFSKIWRCPRILVSSISRQRHGSAEGSECFKDDRSPPKLFVVQPRLRKASSMLQSKLDEALNLANSLEEQRDGYFDTDFSEKKLPPHLVVQNPTSRAVKSQAGTFFGKGTVDNIKFHLNALDSEGGVDAVFVNAILSGVQQRNLERAWETPVLDRVGLIIEIFNAHAYTKEAKLQAELAALMYKKSRLVRVRGPTGQMTFGAAGEAEVVSARGKGTGGRGFISGAGETELQLQRRRILDKRSHLLSQIEEVRRTRSLQRASRKRYGGTEGQSLDTVAVVGYTNAGKSTLVGVLSDADLHGDDRLFATVDPKTRSVILPSGKKVLLSDTVGFISDLPIQLVEAFHATLEEVVEADLLVHVIDSSAPNLFEQRETVLHVLEQIGVAKEKIENMVEVWNKVDLLKVEFGSGDDDDSFKEDDDDYDDSYEGESPHHDTDDPCDPRVIRVDPDMDIHVDEAEPRRECPHPTHEPHVRTSAYTGMGLHELLSLIDTRLGDRGNDSPAFTDRKWRPGRVHEIGPGG